MDDATLLDYAGRFYRNMKESLGKEREYWRTSVVHVYWIADERGMVGAVDEVCRRVRNELKQRGTS